MSVTRLLLPGRPIVPGAVRVPPAAAHHARVARLAAGEAVEVLDLEGNVGVGRLARWDGGSCWVDVDRVETGRGELPAPLVLGLAALHTRAFDWAIEKATELGATAVVPVICARVQGGRHAGRVERWQRIADSAVTQCGRSRSPALVEPQPLSDFLTDSRGRRLVALAGAPMPARVRPDREGVTLLVGPEGGFTEEEVVRISSANFTGLPLGPRTLRAETAAVAALTLAQSLAGWLG